MRHFPSHIPTRMGYGVNAMTLFKPDDLDSVLKKWHRRTLYFAPRIARCDLMHCSLCGEASVSFVLTWSDLLRAT
jgi:hypothetical protein